MIKWITNKLAATNMETEYRELQIRNMYSGNAEKFQLAMSLLNFCNNDQEKLDSIEAITDMIINEIKYDFMNCYIYHNANGMRPYKPLFPYSTWDEKNETVECRYRLSKKELDLEKDRIISQPWKRERAITNILNIKNKDFVFDSSNHKGIYYRPFDICHVSNGNHSVMAGIANKKKGLLLIEEMDIFPIFPYVDTDGERWLHKYKENHQESVCDYRIAIIYKMYKTKYEILD